MSIFAAGENGGTNVGPGGASVGAQLELGAGNGGSGGSDNEFGSSGNEVDQPPPFGFGDGDDDASFPGVGPNEIEENDVNCDNTGTCYDVTVHCKDTRIVVNVGTNRPFSGRVYSLGRSETCNVDIINSNSFRLDLTMGGSDCNTQSVV